MPLDTDLILDRRRLKRRLNGWRIVAIAAVTVAVLVLVGSSGVTSVGQRVVRVNVSGAITEDRKMVETITDLVKDRQVAAVIVSINSPGGSVAGGESLHAAFKQVAAAKPVVAVMRGTAASAGYMIAMPAARVFAREATLTGSIGVILQTGEVSGLLGRLGVTSDALTSGPLKDQPSFTRPLTPAGRDYLGALVTDMYEQFVSIVAVGRRMEPDAVRKLADGRAYTGRQALQLGLVDEIGGETEARAWLARERGVPASTPVTDMRQGTALQRLSGDVATGAWNALVGGSLTPVGAWALWQGGSPE